MNNLKEGGDDKLSYCDCSSLSGEMQGTEGSMINMDRKCGGRGSGRLKEKVRVGSLD